LKSKIKSIDMRFTNRRVGWPLWSVVLLLISVAAAQTGAAERESAWGTSESPTARTGEFETVVGNVSTHGVFSGAQFGSGELDCGTGAPFALCPHICVRTCQQEAMA
jgi:hypothetical protein